MHVTIGQLKQAALDDGLQGVVRGSRARAPKGTASHTSVARSAGPLLDRRRASPLFELAQFDAGLAFLVVRGVARSARGACRCSRPPPLCVPCHS